MGHRLKRKLSLSLDPKLYDQIDAYCKEKDLSRSECVEQFLFLIFNIEGWVASIKAEKPTSIANEFTMIKRSTLKALSTMNEVLAKIQEVEVKA